MSLKLNISFEVNVVRSKSLKWNEEANTCDPNSRNNEIKRKV